MHFSTTNPADLDVEIFHNNQKSTYWISKEVGSLEITCFVLKFPKVLGLFVSEA